MRLAIPGDICKINVLLTLLAISPHHCSIIEPGICEAWGSRGSETVMVHQATTSSWVAGSGNSRVAHKEAPDSENSDIQSLTSEDYRDGRWFVLVPRALAGSEEG